MKVTSSLGHRKALTSSKSCFIQETKYTNSI